MSADGRLLLFTGSTNDSGVLASVVDRQTGRLEVISRARFGGFPDADSYARPSARTACTRYSSRQPTDIVPDDTNGVTDVFVHSSITGRTRRISVGAGGERETGRAAPPASPRTAGSSSSCPPRAISSPATPTASVTSSSGSARTPDGSRSAAAACSRTTPSSSRRSPKAACGSRSCLGDEPRPGRHQWVPRRVHARPAPLSAWTCPRAGRRRSDEPPRRLPEEARLPPLA